MLSRFFLNNSNKKTLAPHAVDVHSWNLSNYYLTMFHICRTIWRQFSLRQVKLCIGQWKCKQKFTTQGSTDRPTDQPSEWIRPRSLNSYFAFCKIVVKIVSWSYLSCLHVHDPTDQKSHSTVEKSLSHTVRVGRRAALDREKRNQTNQSVHTWKHATFRQRWKRADSWHELLKQLTR